MAKYLTVAKIAAIVKLVHPISVAQEMKTILTEAAGGDVDKQATIAALGTTTNIDAVPATFADLAAVRTYLAGANQKDNIETRLDNLEAKLNALIAADKAAGVIAT